MYVSYLSDYMYDDAFNHVEPENINMTITSIPNSIHGFGQWRGRG